MTGPVVYLVAGEPSGDALGAELMRALARETGGAIEFAGVGGPEMEGEGLTSIYPMSELSIMGLVEVVPGLARVLRRLAQTARHLRSARPDVLVTIDSQAFSRRLAERIHPAPFPVVHYVGPTVWAWRPSRIRKVSSVVDRLLLLFPFEVSCWEGSGIDAVYVGHPLADGMNERPSRSRGEGPCIVLLPGSRKAEIRRHLPIFREVAERLARDIPDIEMVIPTVANVVDDVRRGTRSWSCPVEIVERPSAGRLRVMAGADAAMAVSGTVALELASLGIPHVIAYRANPLTAAIVRRLVTVRYASLVNIMADRDVTPEFIQDECRVGAIHDALRRILEDPLVAASQKRHMASVMQALRHPDGPSSGVAARAILELI